MPRRPKHGPDADEDSITGRRKTRQSSVVPLPVQKKKGDALESYEQTVERPGPDSASAGASDGVLPPPDRATPD